MITFPAAGGRFREERDPWWFVVDPVEGLEQHVNVRAELGDEAVETELASSNLCGALDFSKVDAVCGRLETRDVLLKKAARDARCAHRGPGAVPRIAEERSGLFLGL